MLLCSVCVANEAHKDGGSLLKCLHCSPADLQVPARSSDTRFCGSRYKISTKKMEIVIRRHTCRHLSVFTCTLKVQL